MTRTLHLHIGAHRTATTSIQAFLKTNFVPLQRKGYFVPYAAGRHFDLINRIFSGCTLVDEAAADINRRADGKKFPLTDLVISDEDICMRRDLSPLARFRDHYDVQVILSMRRQDLWLESWHQQNVKWQWDPSLAHLTFPEFLKRRKDFFWIDYAATVAQLETLFGPEAIRLIVFEKDQMPEGPIAAFCDAIGLTNREGLEPGSQRNTSLTPMMSEFMRTLPLDEIPGPQRRLFERACSMVDGDLRRRTSGSSGSLLMDHATRQAVLADYAEGNAALARGRFGRDALFLDLLPDPAAPLADQRLPADSYATVEGLVAPMIRALGLLLHEAERQGPEGRKSTGPAIQAEVGRQAIQTEPRQG